MMAKVQRLLFVLDESAQRAALQTGMSIRAKRSKLAVCGSMRLCWLDSGTKSSMFDTKMLRNGWFSKPNVSGESGAESLHKDENEISLSRDPMVNADHFRRDCMNRKSDGLCHGKPNP